MQLHPFRQKQQFFQFKLQEVSEDVQHIIERYFSATVLKKYTISHVTKINNQQWVLRIMGYTLFNQTQHGPLLLDKAKKLCRLSVNPLFIFQELLVEISNQKITRPGYSTLQKIISEALVSERV